MENGLINLWEKRIFRKDHFTSEKPTVFQTYVRKIVIVDVVEVFYVLFFGLFVSALVLFHEKYFRHLKYFFKGKLDKISIKRQKIIF